MLGALQRESLLAMMSGLVVWTLYFLFAYAFLSLGCALGIGDRELMGLSLIHWVILAATAGSLFLMAWLAFRSWQQVRLFAAAKPEKEPFANPNSGNLQNTGSMTPCEAASQETQRRRYFMAVVALSVHGLSVIALLWVAAPVLLRIPPCL